MSTVLVTGASGFVGSHSSRRCCRGHRVVALVRTPAAASWSSAGSRPRDRAGRGPRSAT